MATKQHRRFNGKSGTANHRRSCWRKTRYRSEWEARDGMKRRRHSTSYDGRPLRAYECSHCRGWHIGHEEGWNEGNG